MLQNGSRTLLVVRIPEFDIAVVHPATVVRVSVGEERIEEPDQPFPSASTSMLPAGHPNAPMFFDDTTPPAVPASSPLLRLSCESTLAMGLPLILTVATPFERLLSALMFGYGIRNWTARGWCFAHVGRNSHLCFPVALVKNGPAVCHNRHRFLTLS